MNDHQGLRKETAMRSLGVKVAMALLVLATVFAATPDRLEKRERLRAA